MYYDIINQPNLKNMIKCIIILMFYISVMIILLMLTTQFLTIEQYIIHNLNKKFK